MFGGSFFGKNFWARLWGNKAVLPRRRFGKDAKRSFHRTYVAPSLIKAAIFWRSSNSTK